MMPGTKAKKSQCACTEWFLAFSLNIIFIKVYENTGMCQGTFFFCDEENAVTNGSYGAIRENMI